MSGFCDHTIMLLRQFPGTRREISEATGLGLYWLNRLAQGKIPDPGVRKIERLHSFLSTAQRLAAAPPAPGGVSDHGLDSWPLR